MSDTNFILLYVDNPEVSARWYADLLGRPPVEASPTFVMFPLNSDLMLGLWSRHHVEPPAVGSPGASEIAFTKPDADAVRSTYADWVERGVRIAQPPTAMDFGFTFTAADLDGHRLRVFAPSGN